MSYKTLVKITVTIIALCRLRGRIAPRVRRRRELRHVPVEPDVLGCLCRLALTAATPRGGRAARASPALRRGRRRSGAPRPCSGGRRSASRTLRQFTSQRALTLDWNQDTGTPMATHVWRKSAFFSTSWASAKAGAAPHALFASSAPISLASCRQPSARALSRAM